MKIDVDKGWCLDAAKREDGCEVGAGVSPLVKTRLELTEAQKEINKLREVITGQASEIEARIEEFGIMSAEIARLTALVEKGQDHAVDKK